MVDKNGRQIQTGDVVLVSGGYFKSDNGMFAVIHAPGDPDWYGESCCLNKLCKSGKLSEGKYATAFWPIAVNAGSWRTKMDAKSWNAANAEILVVDDVNHSYIAENFRSWAERLQPTIDRARWNSGEDGDEFKRLENLRAFYISVADRAAAANWLQNGGV